MFIEGYIERDYLEMLKGSGYDIVWEINTRAEAIEHRYSEFFPEINPDITIARIFLDSDMEDLLTPKMMECSVHNMIPLMAVSRSKRLRDYAEKKLTEG